MVNSLVQVIYRLLAPVIGNQHKCIATIIIVTALKTWHGAKPFPASIVDMNVDNKLTDLICLNIYLIVNYTQLNMTAEAGFYQLECTKIPFSPELYTTTTNSSGEHALA